MIKVLLTAIKMILMEAVLLGVEFLEVVLTAVGFLKSSAVLMIKVVS